MADDKEDTLDQEPQLQGQHPNSSAIAKAIAAAGGDKLKAAKVVRDRLIHTQTDLFAGKLKSRQKNDYLLELIEATKLVQKSIVELLPLNTLFQSLRLLAVDKEKIIRSQALRTLRKLVTDVETVKALVR